MRAAETLVWPGGEHAFRLGIGELRALEKACDAGCFTVLMRLLSRQPMIDDILSTIRLGLIGGGMPDREGQQTLDRALQVTNPYALALTAAEVLQRALMWDDADKPGELAAGAERPIQTRSPTDGHGGPDTTEPVLQ